jgi:serine/threonine-protein kinase
MCRAELAEPGSGFLLPGALLNNRYEIARVIASGGMGIVYEAFTRHLGGLRCAIKALKDQTSNPAEQTEAIANFEREAMILARLHHPYLPRVFDHFSERDQHFLVMDYVEGESLEQRLEQSGRRPMNLSRVLHWMFELCDVLEYLHSQSPPVIFRDLKPGNIMITPENQVRLIDFGIARLFVPGKSRDTQALGTPGYSAPEQYGKGQTDERSDLYALGVILHELLTGYDPSTRPFKLPLARQLNPRLPGGIEKIIQKATRLEPYQRYRHVLEFKRDLLALQKELRSSSAWTNTGKILPRASANLRSAHQQGSAALRSSVAGGAQVYTIQSASPRRRRADVPCGFWVALVALFSLAMSCACCILAIYPVYENIISRFAAYLFP